MITVDNLIEMLVDIRESVGGDTPIAATYEVQGYLDVFSGVSVESKLNSFDCRYCIPEEYMENRDYVVTLKFGD